MRLLFTVTSMEKNKGGRPPKPEAERRAVVVALRLTHDMHAKLLRLGGVEWLRDRIARAREGKTPKA
jgi:hypothetical protein